MSTSNEVSTSPFRAEGTNDSTASHTSRTSTPVSEEDVDQFVRSLAMAIDGSSGIESQNQEVGVNIGALLQHDGNLKDLLNTQEMELEMYVDEFIEHHCNEAENLCVMFNQVSECEAKLEEFEYQIVEFLDRLTDTADEVVEMQRSTETLNLRLENRKKVKQEVTQVYEAIMECGKFCEDISHKAIDEVFLREMEEYGDKLAKWHELRDKNKGLVGSAIDMEIRPRLEHAAQKVGDKLQRYLIKRFYSLQEPGINVALHQQIMETTGKHAFRFLLRYNAPISEELRLSYISIISDIYSKALQSSLKDLVEVLPFVNLTFEPVINRNFMELLTDNGDINGLSCFPSPHHSETSYFYFRDEVSMRYSDDNISDTIIDSSQPRIGSSFIQRSQTVSPAAARAAAERCTNNTTGSKGSSKFSFNTLRKNFKGSFLSKIKPSHHSDDVEEMSTPFTTSHRRLDELVASTFEDSIFALRAIHILEPIDNSADQSTVPLAPTHGDISVVKIAAADNNINSPTNNYGKVPENYMGMVVSDPVLMSYLARTDSVVARFVELMGRVVNAVTAERKFIRNFILGGVTDSRRADLEEEEVLRTIFFQALNQIEKVFSDNLPVITDCITLLCCLRATEMLKNFVFKSPSPNPILLLSSLFECITNSIRRRISQLLECDKAALETANGLSLSAVGLGKCIAGSEQDILCAISQNPSLVLALRPHPITLAVSRLTSKLHAINVLRLNGSFVNERSDVSVFDQNIADDLQDIMRNMGKLIEGMAKRFTDISNNVNSSDTGMVFKINNLGHLLYRWLAACRMAQGLSPVSSLAVQHSLPIANAGHLQQLIPGNGHVTAANDTREGKVGSMIGGTCYGSDDTSQVHASLTSPNNTHAASAPNHHTLSNAIKELDTALYEAIGEFIHTDIKHRFPVLHDTIEYIQSHYGELNSNRWRCNAIKEKGKGHQKVSEGALNSERDSVKIDEGTFVAMVTAFCKACQYDHILQVVSNSVRGIFGTSSRVVNEVPPILRESPNDEAEREEISYRVLTDYFGVIVELNDIIVRLAQRYFPDHSIVQAKLISGHAMEYELKKFLR